MTKRELHLIRKAIQYEVDLDSQPRPDALKALEILDRELAASGSPQPEEQKRDTIRKMIEALGFDPTNHHNSLACPYCNPKGLALASQPEGWQPIATEWIEAVNLAKGLCESEANRRERVSGSESSYWRSIATRLGALYLAQDALRMRMPPAPAGEPGGQKDAK